MIPSRAAFVDPSPSLRKAMLVTLALIIVGANSGFSKPIWIDEYLHFAFGALSLSETLAVIRETTGSGVNWGQTGTYFFVSHVTGSVFGPSPWALRLPSILSGLALLMATGWFMRVRGFGTVWQAFAVVAVASQTTLMYYVGEARPYLPMAASVIGALAFFATPIKLRHHWVARALGWFGILLGSILHPYWLPFMGVVAVFARWAHTLEQRDQRSDLRAFLHLPLLAAGLVLYVVMALLTWADGTVTAVVDSLEFVLSVENAIRTLASTHLSALVSVSPILAVLLVFTIAVVALLHEPRLRAPALLMVVGFTSSVALAALSYLRSYWILQRQWVGGMALVALGLAWVAAELWSSEIERFKGARRAVALSLVAVVSVGFLVDLRNQVAAVQEHREVMAVYRVDSDTARDLLLQERDYVRAANVNAVTGGPIWRDHAAYYGRDLDR